MRASIWAAALLFGAAACGDAATSPAVGGETGNGLPAGRGQSGGASTINPSVALANSTMRDCPQRCAFPISVRAGEPTATDANSLTEDAGMLFGYRKPTRWSLSGGGTTLAVPAGYEAIAAVQQNGWGQVAGYTRGGPDGYIATVWEPDGTPIVLSDRPYGPPLSGKARAINDNSVIVGESGGRAFRTHYKDGFRWLSGPGSAAYDINYKGEIVGYSTVDGAPHATVWAPDGTATDLGIAPGAFNYSLAVAISETGIVVGYSAPTRNNFGRFAGFVWSRAEGMTPLPNFVPADVNHWGEVAGQSSETGACAVYYKGYGMLDLPRTTNSKVGCQALSINSWGDVVGFETVEVPGQEYSFKPLVWTWGGNEGRYGF